MTCSWFFVSLSILFTITAVQYTQAANILRIWKQTFGKEGYCHLQCIHDIFAESCEGMNCTMIYEESSEDREKRCKGDCILAVTSDRMRKCLKEGYPGKDVEEMMHVSYYHYPSGCYNNEYKIEDTEGGSIISVGYEEFKEHYDIDHYYY